MGKTEKIFLYIVGGIILAILIGMIISDLTNKNKVTCNSPYIKVGTSCCLDQNSNNVCDNDETIVEPEENVWKFNGFKVYGGEEEEFLKCYYKDGFYSEGGGSLVYNYDYLYDLSPRNIKMSLKKTDKEDNSYINYDNYYKHAIIAVYTDYNQEEFGLIEPERVTCEVEEYYNGIFSEVQTNNFKLYSELGDDKYGYVAYYGYKANDKPSEAKYVISCKGDESGNEIKRTFTFNIEYVDELEKVSC